MSYKTELQNNNARLQNVLDKINALPEIEEPGDTPGGPGFGLDVGSKSLGASALTEYSGGPTSYNLEDMVINGSFISVE